MDETNTPSFSGPALPAQYAHIGNNSQGFGDQDETTDTSFADNDQWGDLHDCRVWFDYLLMRLSEAVDQSELGEHNNKMMQHYFDTTVAQFRERMTLDPYYHDVPKLAKWLGDLMLCFRMPKRGFGEGNDIKQKRINMLRTPEYMKDVFWRVIANKSLDLLQARNMTDTLTGRQEFNDAHISKVSAELMLQSKQFMQLTNTRTHTDAMTWASANGFLNSLGSILPTSLTDMMLKIYPKENNEELKTMLSTGIKWSEFQHENLLRHQIELIANSQQAFFPQTSVVRMFGQRNTAADAPERIVEYCHIFHGLRELLFLSNIPPCSTRESYPNTKPPVKRRKDETESDNLTARNAARFGESQYTPDVPSAGLSEPQINLLWGFYSPVMLGLIYPFFSLPDPNCKYDLMNNLHSSFILSAHGISKTGECVINNCVPFMATLYNNLSTTTEKALSFKLSVTNDCVHICAIKHGELTSAVDTVHSLDVAMALRGGEFTGASFDETNFSPQFTRHEDNAMRCLVFSPDACVAASVATAATPVAKWKAMFTAACDDGQTECDFLVCNGHEFSCANIPPLFIVQNENVPTEYIVYMDHKRTSGIACHTKKLVDYYLKHYKHARTLCPTLHKHNFWLERRAHDNLRDPKQTVTSMQNRQYIDQNIVYGKGR